MEQNKKGFYDYQIDILNSKIVEQRAQITSLLDEIRELQEQIYDKKQKSKKEKGE